MDKSRKAVMLDWIRWILVLPVSLVSSILIMFPIHWAVMLIRFTHKRGDTFEVDGLIDFMACISPEMLERFGYALFVPMVLIITGAEIAPKFKFQTGIAIAILFGTMIGFFSGTVVSGNIRVDMSWLRWVITVILWIAGISCGLYFAHKNSFTKKPSETPQSELGDSQYARG